MKDEHIVRDFVRENLSLLTSPDFDRAHLKRAINDYYVRRHKKKYSFPPNRDCMLMLISLLKGNVPDDEILKMIDTLPFFRETGEREREGLRELLRAGRLTSVLPEDQLKTIKEVGAFEAVVKHKGKELEDRVHKQLAELEHQIEQKQQEYDALPSVLDQEEIEEPDYNPEVEDIKPWWERFYLTADPFPLQDGLSAISKDLYEQVIIKTEPFRRTLSNLRRDPNCLFHSGFLLAGDYGLGKTTFIDYLSNYLINLDILPIRVTAAKPFADSVGFTDSFLHKLRTELYNEARTITAVADAELIDLELEDQIVCLCRKIKSAGRLGIIVFMDDYHKHRSHFPQIFEFLGTLQILKNTLTRAEVNAGFIVSAVPSWLEELKQNSQLLGFLDNTPMALPSVSPELISDVFNRRIAAFCYESTPRRIKPDFVRKLVVDLGGEQGIRGCITRIVSELSHNNTAIVDSPIDITQEVLAGIRRTFERDNTVGPALNKLLFGSRFARFTNEQIARCLELLVHLNVQNGIGEGDRQFVDNAFYFRELRNANLIQKYRVGSTRNFKWNLQFRLGKLVQQIHRDHQLNLADYLLKLYAFKGVSEASRRPVSQETGVVAEIRRLAARRDIKLERAVQEDIQQGLRILDSLLLRDPERPPTEGTLNGALDALDHLSNALFSLDFSNPYFSRLGVRDSREKWMLHPGATESISEALQRVDDYRRTRDLTRLSHAVKQLENVLLEVGQRIRSLVEQMCEATNPLLHRPATHTKEELDLLQQIDSASYSGVKSHHFEYVRALTDYLELRLRKYFFFCGSLTFGPDYFDSCPKSLLSYAYKNLTGRSSYAIEPNKFDGLTRSQFKTIFLEGNELRDHCVRTLELGWKEEDWRVFAETFAAENIKVAHQQVDSFSPIEKNRYRRYANLAEELLAAINQMVSSTLERRTYICVASLATNTPSDCLFQVAFKPVPIRPDEGPNKRVFETWPRALKAFDHMLSDETYQRLLRHILAKLNMSPMQIITEDLLETEYIQTHYRTSLSEFINTLSYAKLAGKELVVEPWLGSSVAIKSISKASHP
jgi:hypothetical protein